VCGLGVNVDVDWCESVGCVGWVWVWIGVRVLGVGLAVRGSMGVCKYEYHNTNTTSAL
jgi:hypothetical protein